MSESVAFAAAMRPAVVTMPARVFADDPAFGHIFPDPADRARRGAAVSAGLARIGASTAANEIATERNLGFYQRPGFAGAGEWRVFGGGPRFWSMLRRPGG